VTTVFDAKMKVARLLARDAARGRASATDAVAAMADAAAWDPKRDVLGKNPLAKDARPARRAIKKK